MDPQLPPTSNKGLKQYSGILQAIHGSTVQVHGGQFVQHNQAQVSHNCYEADDGLKHLQAHVATTAFDSVQPEHLDTLTCHPNTRQAVLNDIMNWIILAISRVQWVLWLNGAAGSGKSNIGRSVVELCLQKNIPIARFFFFRTDSTRNTVKPLVATLVHQLLQSIPALTPIIIPRIQLDSLIFLKSLETQFKYLIFDPLCELKLQDKFPRTLVLFFDGVDECDSHKDQANLIRIITNFVHSNRFKFPVIAFFASRTEKQISTVFRSSAALKVTRQLAMGSNYLPNNEIRRFLYDSFTDIKSTHQFGPILPNNWPAIPDIDEIIAKSLGQFIYAVVLINFLSTPDLHPGTQKQLEIICRLRPCSKPTPFTELDALYRYIFSQVRDIQGASRILAWIILCRRYKPKPLRDCEQFFGLQAADIYAALASLKSVIDYENHYICFLHASFVDFLLDKKRSQEYYIDRATWSTHLLIRAFEHLMSDGHTNYLNMDAYIAEAKCTQALQDCVLSFNPHRITGMQSGSIAKYLDAIRMLDFGDGAGGSIYQQQLNVIVCYLIKNKSSYPDMAFQASGVLVQFDIQSLEVWKRFKRNQGGIIDVIYFLAEMGREKEAEERQRKEREAETLWKAREALQRREARGGEVRHEERGALPKAARPRFARLLALFSS